MPKKSAKKKQAKTPSPGRGPQRLNKVLAAAGLGSRREVEELIVQGRVEIDREIVSDLSCKVDPAEVTIKVDGQTLKRFRPVYFALNKPKGVLSTNKDPSGRMRVVDLIPGEARVFSVGRLDRSSEGLTLLTNDGELAQRLAHPKFRVQKTYFVVVSGQLTKEELDKLRKGVHLAEGFARVDGATIRRHRKGCTEVEIVLSEGKNREIRRLLARAGHKVQVLRRIAIGPLRLGTLPVGASRELTSTEVKALYDYALAKRGTKKKKSATSKKTRGKPGATTQSTVAPVPSWDDDDDWGGESSLDLDWMSTEPDDDFVLPNENTPRQGSVLGYEGDSQPASSSAPRGKRAVKKKTARGSSEKNARVGGRSKKKAPTRGAKSSTGTRGKPGGKRAAAGAKSKTAAGAKSKTAAGAKSKTAKRKTATSASRSNRAKPTGKPKRGSSAGPKRKTRGRK